MGEIIRGKIVKVDEDQMYIVAPMVDADRFMIRRYDEVLVELADGRSISPEQRRKAHAIIGEIADWQGDIPEALKRITKLEFIVSNMNSLAKKMFSLADCDMTTAREFISYLVDFVLRWDVPTHVSLRELCDDIEHYVYACLMNRKCAVCQKKRADLHHWVAIGMGRDRTEVAQIGWPVISLCREHHGKAHSEGRSWLEDDIHLVPIPMDEKIAKVYKISKKAQRPIEER